MGDRANILVLGGSLRGERKEKVGIFLYSHWGGSDLPKVLHKALNRRQRWDDEAYLTRIIMCEVIGKEDFEGETGFGISLTICDNEYPILVVDVASQTVGVSLRDEPFEVLYTVTFDEYCALSEDALATFRKREPRKSNPKASAKRAGKKA